MSEKLLYSKQQIIDGGNASAQARELVGDYFTDRISVEELLSQLRKYRRIWRKNRPGWKKSGRM